MEKSFIIHYLFIFVILTCSCALITYWCFPDHKWRVHVMSDISDNIVAHIKSGDDDLGSHTLPFNGEYEWSFCNRVDGKTLFYGYFWWGSRYQTLALFDNNILDICAVPAFTNSDCYWSIRPDGFYASPSNSPLGDDNWQFIKSWG
ncbi:hypothetical protein L6452_43197 [Arctium lappa]|uniref:Uncharacterized protein n=1 Tax=Arctium lappa TaxID=4217 RepID=A0ACB8XJT7_ARCLA|nr:hypothetical protein L6452_43197 [Arctium lappa]